MSLINTMAAGTLMDDGATFSGEPMSFFMRIIPLLMFSPLVIGFICVSCYQCRIMIAERKDKKGYKKK